MLLKTKARLLSAEEKPYDFDGRSGVSTKIRVLIESSIFSLRATPQDVAQAKQYIDKDGNLEFSLESLKEETRLRFVSFR